jgi:putative tricarboxylic transport membrane protein
MTEPPVPAQQAGGGSGAAPSALDKRVGRALPYVVVLVIVCVLFVLAERIGFVAPGGRIGPNFWPKAILLLAMITCVYAIAKALFLARGEHDLQGVLGSVLKEVPAKDEATLTAEAPEPRFPLLLWTGIALTIGYLLVIEKLGFFLTTALYLGLFMWIGRYRRVGVIVATSVLGALFFVFMFMKVVYVSLPLGVGPFAEVSFALMKLLGIK